MRPLQIRLRFLVIIVAIVAVGLTGLDVARRSYFCRERMRFFTLAASQRRGSVDSYELNRAFLRDQAAAVAADPRLVAKTGWDNQDQILASIAWNGRQADHERQLAEEYTGLVKQYERAMWRFWEPLPREREPESRR